MTAIVAKTMNSNLRNVYESEIDNRNIMTNNVLRFHRDRGKVIFMVKSGKSLDGKKDVDYGPKPVEVLAEAMGISVSYVYKLSTFYEIYANNEDFDSLIDFFDQHKYHLTWSHFNLLVHVTDNKLREQLIYKAVEDNMPVSALRKEIASKKIELDEDGFEPPTTDSPVLSGETTSAPVELEQDNLEDAEEEEDEEEVSEDTRSPDSSPTKLGSVRLIKNLNNASAKFGDKLVDLVGDLTISLAEPPGGKLLKEVLKGISSATEILSSVKEQIGEYINQLEEMATTLKTNAEDD